MPGGKRGLSVPAGCRDRPGPVLVVEGPTDALALTAAGLAAVGRPSAAGGVGHLAGLLADLDPARDVLVVGENDRKDDGSWPGRAGAESIARGLAGTLGRPVKVAYPPDGAKDVRDWLTDPARADTPWPDRGAGLLAHLTATAADPPPPGPDGPDPDGPPVEAADDPHRLAAGFLAARPGRLRYWRGDFLRYEAGAYRPVPDADLRAGLTAWVRDEFVRLWRLQLAAWRAKAEDANKPDTGPPPAVRKVNANLVGNVVLALRGLCLLTAAAEPPAWVDGADGPDPATVVAFPNGLLDLPAAADGRPGCLLTPSESFFTLDARPFPFDPAAPPPAEWLRFLNALWPDDPDCIGLLQEWFGYCLVGDPSMQKLLFGVGPKRGGKGTVARVLRELVGADNYAGPTLASLGTNFGLSALLGKSVAVVADARVGGRTDAGVVVERLLAITGEDALTVDRKYRERVAVRLPTRFVILSNELPRLADASAALTGRMLVLPFPRSWYGREDPGLFGRLRAELPGILL